MSSPSIPKPPEFCSVEMSDGEPCGRAVHPQRTAEDTCYVCLMHSHDYNKDQALFDAEIRSIMGGTSIYNREKNKLDFQSFVFFKPTFTNWGISLGDGIEVNFTRATFARRADFSNAYFDCEVNFSGARFDRESHFEYARFVQSARFWGASFSGGAYFSYSKFVKGGDFSNAAFRGDAHFARTVFSDSAIFKAVSFCGDTFFAASFANVADFSGATFEAGAQFYRVAFSSFVDFRNTT